MWNDAHDAYLETKVLTADPIELVNMLYQAGLEAVRDARVHLAEGRIAERSRAITRACQVVIELVTSLDHERGGEISRRLALLYDYMHRRLLEANMKQSDEPLADVLGLLTTLSEAWDGIRSSEGKPADPALAPQPAAQNAWSQPAAENPWSPPAQDNPWSQPATEPAWSQPAADDPWSPPAPDSPWAQPLEDDYRLHAYSL